MTGDLVHYLAERFRDRPALLEPRTGRVWTYRELDAEAGRWAGLLVEHRIGAGDHVAIVATNRAVTVALLFSCWKVGAALAPINSRLSRDEMHRELDRIRPTLVMTGTEVEGALDLRDARGGSPVPIDVVPPVSGAVAASAPTLGEATGLILSTGGSTGAPKSAKLSVRALVANALNTASAWGLTGGDVGLAPYPFFHTGGWNVLTLPLLLAGGATAILDRSSPAEVLAEIPRTRPTILSAVPTTAGDIVRLPEFAGTSFASVRFVKTGGGLTPEPVVQRFRERKIRFFQGYGLTEAGPNLFYSTDADLERPGSIGRATPLAELELRDPDGRPGEEGELWVRGPLTFSGYLGDAGATREVVRQGWVATGDLLRRDVAGFYYFVGRCKQMYKSGGENVYPTEVENAIESHPSVAESAVIGIPDPRWGEVGCAFVRTVGPLTDDELATYLRERLAHFKVPRRVVRVTEIPRTPAGKKDYPRLRREGEA